MLADLQRLSETRDPDDLAAISDVVTRMTEAGASPDFRSALAENLARLAKSHPALQGTHLGERPVDIQLDYESASFDRSRPGDIPEH